MCDSETADTNCWITPDSGTSSSTFPLDKFMKVSNFLFPPESPCADVKAELRITFRISGVDYTLNWEDLIDDYHKNGVKVCDVRISPLDILQPGYDNLFIVGGIFMKKYYTVFDRLDNRVGFRKDLN